MTHILTLFFLEQHELGMVFLEPLQAVSVFAREFFKLPQILVHHSLQL